MAATARWLALRLLCVGLASSCGVLHDATICAGKTVGGSTDWVAYKTNKGLQVDIDTSLCGYDSAPVYVTSLAGIRNHTWTTGSSEIYLHEATSFRTFIRYLGSDGVDLATDFGWHVNWFADSHGSSMPGRGVCSGKTEHENTAWQQGDGSNTIYVDVDTSACGFQSTPVYVTSVSADKNVWLSRGSSEIYQPTATGFRIYLYYDYSSIYPSRANGYGWHVNWLADTTACSGRTVSGSTNWVEVADGVYVDVDTSTCSFQNTPVYVTSLAGTEGHFRTRGSSEIHTPTATGFRIYIESPGTTAAAANAYSWHVNWIARSQATSVPACTDTNGVAASAQYPCACGMAACEQGQLCLSQECLCQVCPPGFRLLSTGCQKAVYFNPVGGGASPCVQLLGHAVVNNAEAGATRGHIHVLRITLGAVPSDFFAGLGLAATTSGAPSLDSLDVQSDCTQGWTVTPASGTGFNATTASLGDACVLSASHGEGVVRQGSISVYGDSSDSSRRWTVEVHLRFESVAGSMLTVNVDGEEDADDFSATLDLQADEESGLLSNPYSLTVGDLKLTEQEEASSDLTFEVAIVLLSTPHGEDDSGVLLQNITQQVSEGGTQFTFVPGISSFASCLPPVG